MKENFVVVYGQFAENPKIAKILFGNIFDLPWFPIV